MRTLVAVTIVAVAVAVAGCGGDGDDAPEASAAAAAATTTAAAVELPPAGARYVAMGSSFAAGPLIPVVQEVPCLRSSANYPQLVAAELGLELVDVWCSGATVANHLDTAQGDQLPQLEAVTAETELVTITAGGNDVGYLTSIVTCATAAVEARPCGEEVLDRATLDDRFEELPGSLVGLLDAVGGRAPDAEVLLVGYPRVAPDEATPCPPSIPTAAADLERQADVGRRLDQAFRTAAEEAGVELVDTDPPSEGRAGCAPPAERWVEGRVPGSPAAAFHPNATGMAATVDLVLRTLGREG